MERTRDELTCNDDNPGSWLILYNSDRQVKFISMLFLVIDWQSWIGKRVKCTWEKLVVLSMS